VRQIVVSGSYSDGLEQVVPIVAFDNTPLHERGFLLHDGAAEFNADLAGRCKLATLLTLPSYSSLSFMI
jgi:hypothetical protein